MNKNRKIGENVKKIIITVSVFIIIVLSGCSTFLRLMGSNGQAHCLDVKEECKKNITELYESGEKLLIQQQWADAFIKYVNCRNYICNFCESERSSSDYANHPAYYLDFEDFNFNEKIITKKAVDSKIRSCFENLDADKMVVVNKDMALSIATVLSYTFEKEQGEIIPGTIFRQYEIHIPLSADEIKDKFIRLVINIYNQDKLNYKNCKNIGYISSPDPIQHSNKEKFDNLIWYSSRSNDVIKDRLGEQKAFKFYAFKLAVIIEKEFGDTKKSKSDKTMEPIKELIADYLYWYNYCDITALEILIESECSNTKAATLARKQRILLYQLAQSEQNEYDNSAMGQYGKRAIQDTYNQGISNIEAQQKELRGAGQDEAAESLEGTKQMLKNAGQ